MKPKRELGLIIIKPPYAGNSIATNKIIKFTNDKLIEKFNEYPVIIYNFLIDNGNSVMREIYKHLENKWEDFEKMLNDFNNKPVHPFILNGVCGMPGFLKEITGKTHHENNPNTIRGMMRQHYGAPDKEWLNYVHVPHSKEVSRDLNTLIKLNIISEDILLK